METIQSELSSHYPYLYTSHANSTIPMNQNQDRNPQSVPFPHGSFFGPTQVQVEPRLSAKSSEDSASSIQSKGCLILLHPPNFLLEIIKVESNL